MAGLAQPATINKVGGVHNAEPLLIDGALQLLL